MNLTDILYYPTFVTKICPGHKNSIVSCSGKCFSLTLTRPKRFASWTDIVGKGVYRNIILLAESGQFLLDYG